MPDPDVLIVGAGPAGSVAALVLARSGVKVLLVDREQFPRDKLCGDTLNPGSLSILDRLDDVEGSPPPGQPSLDQRIGMRVRAQAMRITGMTVTGPGEVAVDAEYPDGITGAAISRRDLDSLLLESAIRAGAEFAPGTTVREAVVSNGRVTGVRAGSGKHLQTIRGRVTIAADGRRSTIAFGLGLARFARAPRRWAYGAYFSGVEGLTSRGEMHIRRDGYIGVAPLPGGVANVCVVREPRLRLREEAVPGQLLARAVSADPLLAGRFTKARRVSRPVSLGPLGVEAAAAGLPGLVLAGDASGFVDPMTGDGLRFAIRGGELAARAALRELDTGVPVYRDLAAERSREFSGKWRLNRSLRWLVGFPRGVSFGSEVASYWPAPVRLLVGIAADLALVRAAQDPRGAAPR